MKVKHGASNARKVPFNTINSRIAAISSRFDTLEANNAKLSKEQFKRQLAEVVGRAAKSRTHQRSMALSISSTISMLSSLMVS